MRAALARQVLDVGVMLARKILVVDDSNLLHRMYDVLLAGHELIHACDGAQALERLAEHGDVDLVLLDINMPKLDGLEVLRRIKDDARTARLPVIMVSTHGKDADTDRALRAGASGYVKKPFRQATIIELIRAIDVEPA
jgi:CheY-like chemotaxis protein